MLMYECCTRGSQTLYNSRNKLTKGISSSISFNEIVVFFVMKLFRSCLTCILQMVNLHGTLHSAINHALYTLCASDSCYDWWSIMF